MALKPRRRTLMAIGTAAIVLASTFVGVAAPASAAPRWGQSGTTKVYFHGSSGNRVDTYNASGIVRGSGAQVSVKFYYKVRFYGSPSKPKNSTLSLQRKVSGKWHTIKSIKPKRTSGYSITAEIPPYFVPAGVPAQTVQYRVKLKKSGKIVQGDTSTPIKIKYENQSMYTGFAYAIYASIAQFCPTASVRIDPTLASNDRAGQFSTQKGISIDPTVESYTVEKQQGVGLHECAHMKQFYNWGASIAGDKKAAAASAALFINDINPDPNVPTDPVVGAFDPYEHAADCASHALQPAGYLGYGGYCNPNELAAGQRLMSGSRY